MEECRRYVNEKFGCICSAVLISEMRNIEKWQVVVLTKKSRQSTTNRSNSRISSLSYLSRVRVAAVFRAHRCHPPPHQQPTPMCHGETPHGRYKFLSSLTHSSRPAKHIHSPFACGGVLLNRVTVFGEEKESERSVCGHIIWIPGGDVCMGRM